VAAGATVVRDVPDFALVAGVPARRIGWVGRAGVPLQQRSDDNQIWTCPTTGATYRQVDDHLEEY
jgi:serine acetyltransferase